MVDDFVEGQLDHKMFGDGSRFDRARGTGGCDGITKTYDRGLLLEYQKMDAVIVAFILRGKNVGERAVRWLNERVGSWIEIPFEFSVPERHLVVGRQWTQWTAASP